MRYENGAPAVVGDVVLKKLGPDENGQEIIGILLSATISSGGCDGIIQPLARRVSSAAGSGAWQPYFRAHDECVVLKRCVLIGRSFGN